MLNLNHKTVDWEEVFSDSLQPARVKTLARAKQDYNWNHDLSLETIHHLRRIVFAWRGTRFIHEGSKAAPSTMQGEYLYLVDGGLTIVRCGRRHITVSRRHYSEKGASPLRSVVFQSVDEYPVP